MNRSSVLSGDNCMFEGAYVVHLRRLLHPNSGVPKERVRIYWTVDFVANPAAVVRDALAFVGADPSHTDLENVTSVKHNARPKAQTTEENPELVVLPHLRKDMEAWRQPSVHSTRSWLPSFLKHHLGWLLEIFVDNASRVVYHLFRICFSFA